MQLPLLNNWKKLLQATAFLVNWWWLSKYINRRCRHVTNIYQQFQSQFLNIKQILFNPFTASCENAMTLSVPGVPASCEKFPLSSQLNFWTTESIFNQFSVFLKTLNALCVCLQYKHPRSMKESLGQTSQSLRSTFSGRTNATSVLSLGVA
jgi:hypothetical protein